MSWRAVAASALGALLTAACGASGPLVEAPDEPFEEATRTDQNHLLLYPISDAAGLLGRAVQRTEDGKWTIADARAAGCEVRVKPTKAAYEVKRTVDLSSLTSVSAGFAQVIGLEARYGAADKVDIAIVNSEILEADLRGPCGEVVVDRVFVGKGQRALVRTRTAGGSVTGAIGPVAPGAAHEGKAEILDTLSWADEQAYGFTFRQLATSETLTVRAVAPSQVTEGDRVELRFETNRPAWLVVYFLEQSGKGTVLWPSAEEPEPTSQPGTPAVLPSKAEKQQGFELVAQLAEPGKPTRETLVVYAFSAAGDFHAVKPAPGTARDDGAALAAELTQRLEPIPLSRWSRALVHYVIQPK